MGLSSRQFRQTDEFRKAYLEYESNPILFGREMAPKMAKVKSPDFHYELANLWLDDSVEFANIICPRGHGKTSVIGTIIPLHHIIFDKGSKMILICSKTQGHAISILAQIKQIFYNKKFRYMFGDWTEATAKTWSKNEVILKDNTRIVCRGTGQQVRGIFHDWQRPTLILLDDLEDGKNTRTEDAMNTNYEWVINDIEPAIDPQKGRVFSIGTPIHQLCIVERLSERKDTWKTVRYSAEVDEDREKALWPEWMPWDKLKKIEADREREGRLKDYAQEYLCKIIPSGQRLFRREYLQYYSGDIEWKNGQSMLRYYLEDNAGNKVSDERVVPVNIYTGIDPAATTGAQSDWFVIFHIAVDADNNRYVLPYVRAKMRPSEAIEVIWNQYQRYKPRRVSIETSGQQNIIRDILMNMEDRYIPGLARKHNPRDKKEKRHHEILEPWLSKKKVFMKRTQRELIDELYMWPSAKHDDLMDGFYYSTIHARPPSNTNTKRDKKEVVSNPEDSWLLT